MSDRPTFLDPAKAAEALRATLDPKAPVTVADAAAKSGLALRDAERGLQALTNEYRGQLRVTSEGELVYRFPTGFTKPWETRDAIDRAFTAIGRAIIGAMRFVTRAWIAIVLVGYALLFLAILLGITFAGSQGNDSRRRSSGIPGGELLYVFLRVIGDAFFWTFHPFSPFYVGAYGGYDRAPMRRRDEGPKVPLYERVNRFFYGPTPQPEDPRATEKLVVAAIRAGKGRIGLADVMRVTGLARDKADPMMARLMLDYDGDVDVSDDGGIVYRFPNLRKTADEAATYEPPAAWDRPRPQLAPFTGNGFGTNVLIALLNGFNLMMSAFAMTHDLTLHNVTVLFSGVRYPVFEHGTAIALGIVPFVFSLLLFSVPVARAIARPFQKKRAAEERGRLAVLREVIERTQAKRPIDDAAIEAAWARAAGGPPAKMRITQELTELGGDVEVTDDGQARWRFVDLETETAALEAERAAAPEEEKKLGAVVFDTE